MMISKAAALTTAFLFAYGHFACGQENTLKTPAVAMAIDYSSPQGVFESAYYASRKRDWKSYWACLIPTAMRSELFGAYLDCRLAESEEARRIMTTHIDNQEAFQADVKARIKAKQAAGNAHVDKTLKSASPNDTSNEVADALFAHIQDKAGFYAAVTDLIEPNSGAQLGKLEELVITGDTATARMKSTTWSTEDSLSDPVKRYAHENYVQIDFRKIGEKWLLETPL